MGLPLNKIAELVGGRIIGEDDLIVTGINSLDSAGPNEISFLKDPRLKDNLAKTKACAVLVPEKTDLFKGSQVIVQNPGLAYAKVASLFVSPVPRYAGISKGASIHESTKVGQNISIYPNVYIEEKADIGDDVTLFPGVFIGARTRIGNGCIIFPNVVILHDCVIGNSVIIHAGTVIGSDGFGFVKEGSRSVKIPQTGIVQIDDEVEIGANNCIDRATLGKTWIKRGVKTDNLVQVGHNVVIGENSIIVAQVGISGSVQIGREVVIGGQVGIVDHLKIGDRAMIGAQSGVARSVPHGEIVSGYPAIPHRLWLRISGHMMHLPEYQKRLKRVEKRLDEMEK